MKSTHYFIAVPLPDFLKERYARWQQMLKQYVSYKQWPHPDDLHITLKFLGGVSQEQFQKLARSLKMIQNSKPFTLTTGPLGMFGDPRRPRVIWAGIKPQDELTHLQQKVEQITKQIGFQPDTRAYTPHITLAKKWSGGYKDLSGLETPDRINQTFSVDKVVVYRIYPGRRPKYVVAASYQLKGEET